MNTKTHAAALVASLALLSVIGSAYAEGGIVQDASKNAAKGAIRGVQQEMNTGEVVKGAKEVTKSMVQGMADAAPLVTSQIANQANVNRKAIGKVARELTSDAVAGVMGTSMREVSEALGKDGKGPLTTTLSASSEQIMRGTVRGIVAEARMDPATAENLSAAFVRGAMSQMHFNFSVWPLVLAFVLGGLSTFLFGLGLTLLYVLFKRKQEATTPPPVVAQVPIRAHPVPNLG